jgi:hypothetical protein
MHQITLQMVKANLQLHFQTSKHIKWFQSLFTPKPLEFKEFKNPKDLKFKTFRFF